MFEAKQPGLPSVVCCLELALQPAGVPGNESRLYGAGAAQREAQWVRQMAKAGPVEQFIRQTQPFLLQDPDTLSASSLSEPLREVGCG